MTTPGVATQRSLLEGVANFRDLGGHRTTDGRRVRTGLLYRSGALHALTDADHAHVRSLGIRTAFDLRPPLEQAAEPTAAAVHVLSVPLARGASTSDLSAFTDADSFLHARYREILLDLAGTLGYILRTIAEGECLPAVIHCAAGKDRTGVTAAVLLLALGVPESTVLDDYELTSQYEAARRVEEMVDKLAGSGLSPALAAGLLGTSRSALAAGLAEVRQRFGDIDGYLHQGAGLSSVDLGSLRARLLA